MICTQRLLASFALGLTALALAAGPAYADGAGNVSPDTVAPGGSVTFSTVCAEGVTSADVAGTTLGLYARIPMDAGQSPGAFEVSVTIPSSTSPGGYSVSIDCADGSSSVVALVVSPSGTNSGGGGVATGGGATARGLNTGLLGAGAGLVLIATIGTVVVRRRTAG